MFCNGNESEMFKAGAIIAVIPLFKILADRANVIPAGKPEIFR